MGNCGSNPEPDLRNVCTKDDVGKGDTLGYQIKFFCAPDNGFLDGEEKRIQYCKDIDGGEWEYEDQGPACTYNDCNNYQQFPSGCCKGCCGIAGRGVLCKRKSYTGNKLNCCFRDMDWNSSNNFCFETDNEKKTCDPNSRNITGDVCRDEIFDFCTGRDLDDNDISWFDRWKDGSSEDKSCLYALRRNLFGNPNTPSFNSTSSIIPSSLFIDSDGFSWSQELLDEVFQKYTDQGFVVGTIPGLEGYGELQDTLFTICKEVPGLCENALNNVCSNETTENLSRNPARVPWCGCYLPNNEYTEYEDNFQVNKECTPICARTGNIAVASADGTSKVLCTDNICIIDDVTITLAQTDVGGGINFAQFCGGCSDTGSKTTLGSNISSSMNESCRCVIDGININTANSRIGGGIDLNQNCGSNTECYRPNSDPNGPPVIQVDCNEPNNTDPGERQRMMEAEAEAQERFRRNVIIAIIFIIIVGVILLLFYLAGTGKNSKSIIYDRITKKQNFNFKNTTSLSSTRGELFSNNIGINKI